MALPLPNIHNPNFSYVLGAFMGDGWLCSNKRQIVVVAKDRDFIESVRLAFQKTGVKAFMCRYRALWLTGVTRKLLGEFINNLTLEDLEKIVSQTNDHKIQFIRGFFDAEGTVCDEKGCLNGIVKIRNTDLKLLNMVKRLLESLNIIPTRIYIDRKGGGNCFGSKDVYGLHIIRRDEVSRFYELVGSNIKRKKIRMQTRNATPRTRDKLGRFLPNKT
jgi:intein-encoded DNA endonuclease-like protein